MVTLGGKPSRHVSNEERIIYLLLGEFVGWDEDVLPDSCHIKLCIDDSLSSPVRLGDLRSVLRTDE
jgi:hypothetical protein